MMSGRDEAKGAVEGEAKGGAGGVVPTSPSHSRRSNGDAASVDEEGRARQKKRAKKLPVRFYVWGWNANGQLGLGVDGEDAVRVKTEEELAEEEAKKHMDPAALAAAAAAEEARAAAGGDTGVKLDPIGNHANPIIIKSFISRGTPKACAIGRNHSLFLTDDGTCYSAGDDTFGQLGLYDLPDPEDELYEETKRKINDLVKPCPTSIMRRGSIGKLMAKHLEGEGPKPKVTAVACGLYTSYCIIDGRVHAWGRNDRGQCGLGHTTPVDAPSLVPYLRWAHTVWAGGSHVLALNDKHELWVWGRNSEGQLGLGHQNDELFPTRHRFMRNTRIISAGAGEMHSGLVCETDDDGWLKLGDGVEGKRRILVMFGDNRHSQCGLRGYTLDDFALETTTEMSDRKREEIRRVQEMDASFAKKKWSGSRGRGRRRGGSAGMTMRRLRAGRGGGAPGSPLGRPPLQRIDSIASVSSVASGASEDGDDSDADSEVPKKLQAPETVRERLIREEGLRPSAGEDGPGGPEFILLPQTIQSLSGKDLAQVACGRYHTLALTVKAGFEEDARLYAFGSGSYGQLGVGDTVTRYNPTELRTVRFQGITDIYAGGRFSMAITSEGLTFTWGWGWHGDGGHGDHQLNVSPVVIEPLRRVKMVYACCGERSVAAIGKILPKKLTKEEELAKRFSKAHNEPPPKECAHWVGFPHTESGCVVKMRFSCAPCNLSAICRACARRCHRFHAVTCTIQHVKFECMCGPLDSCRALPAGDD